MEQNWLARVLHGPQNNKPQVLDAENVRLRQVYMEALEIKAQLAARLDMTMGNPPADPFHNLWENWYDEDVAQYATDACSTAYACVQRYLMAQRTVRWVLRRKGKGNMPSEDTKHKVSRLLRYPNADLSQLRMRERCTLNMLHHGHAYWQIGWVGTGSRREAKELNHIDSARVVALPDRANYVKGYAIFEDPREARMFQAALAMDVNTPLPRYTPHSIVPKDSMIVFMMESPCSIYKGKGPMEAARRLINADNSALQWWGNQIKKGVRKSGILSFKHDYTEDEFDDADRLLRRDVIGPQSVGGILLMGQAHNYTPLDSVALELDFSKSREMIADEIAAIFAVPPPMIGKFSSSGYNNMQIARMIFWLDTVLPFLDLQKDALNFFLLNPQIDESEWDELEIDYDLSRVEALLQVTSQRLDQALKMRKMLVPLDEIFKYLQIELPSFKGSNTGWGEKNLAPNDLLMDPTSFMKRDVPSDPANKEPGELVKDPKPAPAKDNESVADQGHVERTMRGQTLERRGL